MYEQKCNQGQNYRMLPFHFKTVKRLSRNTFQLISIFIFCNNLVFSDNNNVPQYWNKKLMKFILSFNLTIWFNFISLLINKRLNIIKKHLFLKFSHWKHSKTHHLTKIACCLWLGFLLFCVLWLFLLQSRTSLGSESSKSPRISHLANSRHMCTFSYTHTPQKG